MKKIKIDSKKKHIINICVFSFVGLSIGFMAGSGIVASVSNDIFDNYDLTPKADEINYDDVLVNGYDLKSYAMLHTLHAPEVITIQENGVFD